MSLIDWLAVVAALAIGAVGLGIAVRALLIAYGVHRGRRMR